MIKSSECDPILHYCQYNGWSICERDNIRLPNLKKILKIGHPKKNAQSLE